MVTLSSKESRPELDTDNTPKLVPRLQVISAVLLLPLCLYFVNCFTWTWHIPQATKHKIPSYVYWTVGHLDSWIKTDQLDVTCFIISLFNAQHVSDVSTSNLRSLFVELFRGLYLSVRIEVLHYLTYLVACV